MTAIPSVPTPAQRGRRVATFLGVATYVFGFLTMALHALTGPLVGTLPTMWQSWGGTVGDTVLPFVVYGVVRAAQLLGPGSVHPASYVLGALGGVAGGVAQGAWLLDPEPYTNWMLVSPHVFSFIGWYHFAFLVLVSGMVAGTVMEVLVRGRRARNLADESIEWDRRLRLVFASKATAATLTAVLVFTAAVAADSIDSLESMASIGTTVGAFAGPAAAILFGVSILGSSIRLIIRPLLCAIGATTLLVGLAVLAVRLL